MKTYGSITLDTKHKKWRIQCEPHVAIRLKRVFGKIDTKEFGVQTLSATIENARDLTWFIQRYPMTVDPEDTLLEMTAAHREKMSLIDQLIAGYRPPKGFTLALPPREYQSYAADLWLTANGLLLADDVGIGKTVTSICGFTDPRVLPAVVVTLTHLPTQWEGEIKRFTPDLIVHRLRRGQPYDILKYTDGKYPDVIITNYHKLAGWAETLSPYTNGVIYDECQELRHSGSNKYQAAKHLADACDFRLGLSATPIYNYGGEMFNVLDVLCPGRLGTHEEFVREWCTVSYDGKNRIKDPKAFGMYLREEGLMLRRTRVEVKRELPECQTVPHHIEADPKALEEMKGQAIELAKLILKQTQDFKGQKMQASGEFDNKMRQMTGIAKAPFVAEFVKFLIADNDERIVLFGWHREVYKIWMEKLKEFNPVMYTGSETPVAKDAAKADFISGKSRVLMISLRAGAGLDGLQDVCHLCVFGELDWSPGVHEQCIGRIHRDGQDEPVTAYYLLSNTGADPVMSDVLGLKKAQIEGVRDPNQDLVTKLQVNEDYIKKLAESYLTEHGVAVPQEKPTDVQ